MSRVWCDRGKYKTRLQFTRRGQVPSISNINKRNQVSIETSFTEEKTFWIEEIELVLKGGVINGWNEYNRDSTNNNGR